MQKREKAGELLSSRGNDRRQNIVDSKQYAVRSKQKKNKLPTAYCLLPTVCFLAFATCLLLLTSCGSSSTNNNSTSASDNSVIVSGRVQFEDRTFDSTGFTGTQNKAVRFADIEIINSSDSSIVTSTSTDQNGNYSVTISPSSSSVYVRCLTSTSTVFSKGTKVYNIEVVDNYSNVYSIVSGSFSATSPISHLKNLTASLDSGAGGPFNILDTLIDGTEFVASKNGGFT